MSEEWQLARTLFARLGCKSEMKHTMLFFRNYKKTFKHYVNGLYVNTFKQMIILHSFITIS